MLLFSMENNHLYHADMCTVISYPYHQFMYIFTLWLVFSYQHFTIAEAEFHQDCNSYKRRNLVMYKVAQVSTTQNPDFKLTFR